MPYNYKKLVVKIGSNVLTQSNGLPDTNRIRNIVTQIVALKQKGTEVILVSSGAVASGRSRIIPAVKADAVAARQLLAAVGQVQLMNTYAKYFDESGYTCAQVLVTKEDFRDRRHYLNMKNCFNVLLQHNVIPVVNENDVVSVTELMFTDNDELAGLVAAMLNTDALVILSNVDGIYDGDPAEKAAKVIREIKASEKDFASFVLPGKSGFGRGGMITKSAMAQKIAGLGIPVHIANGTKDDMLLSVMAGEAVHTRFTAARTASGTRKWLASSGAAATGEVIINEGARTALLSGKAASLLPVGLVLIQVPFQKGDIIRILDEAKALVGIGIAQYSADKAAACIGLKNEKPLVHYDYFYAPI